jgi:hypothetical protein
LDLNKQEQPWDQKPLRYIGYQGFGSWEESVSTAGVTKWRESRARVNVWHICQVGTARVTGGVYSSIEGSTHSSPITSRDFAKEKHEGSTLQLARMRVARSAQRGVNHCLSEFPEGRVPKFNTPTHEVASCEKALALSSS